MSTRFYGAIDTGISTASLTQGVGSYKSHVVFPSAALYAKNPASGWWTVPAANVMLSVSSELYHPFRADNSSTVGVSLETDNLGTVLAGRLYIAYSVDIMNFALLHDWVLVNSGLDGGQKITYKLSMPAPNWTLYRI